MPIELSIGGESLWGFLLALARVSGIVALVPIPGWRQAPDAARLMLAMSMTFALAPLWPTLEADKLGWIGIIGLVIRELLFGISVGLAVNFLLEGFAIAAQILGLQAGYSYASTIDPATEADNGVLQIILQIAASLLFFSFGLEAEVIRALAQSFDANAAVSITGNLAQAERVLLLGAGMWKTAVRLSMPVVGLLLMLDISMAVLGRIATQLQLLTLAFPAKMLMSLAILSFLAGTLPQLFREQASWTVQLWQK